MQNNELFEPRLNLEVAKLVCRVRAGTRVASIQPLSHESWSGPQRFNRSADCESLCFTPAEVVPLPADSISWAVNRTNKSYYSLYPFDQETLEANIIPVYTKQSNPFWNYLPIDISRAEDEPVDPACTRCFNKAQRRHRLTRIFSTATPARLSCLSVRGPSELGIFVYDDR